MGADSKTKVALLIVGEGATGAPGDGAIGKRLETLGYQTVEVFDSHGSMAEQFDGKTLVVVSSLDGSASFGAALKLKRVPVVVADGGTLDALGMVTERGEETGPPASLAVGFNDLEHSLAATNAGTQVSAAKFFQKEKLKQREGRGEGEVGLLWGKPLPTAQRVAWLRDDPERKSLIFAYERGDLMRDCLAPARRVAIPFGGEAALAMTSHGWALFDAAVAWAVGEELKQFAEVFTEEWREVRERRRRQRIYASRSNGQRARWENQDSPPRNLAGLALSGGGIRSATFSLGLLQGMCESRVLRLFDYVSTVSGGGYVGGWWSAWLSRGQLEGHDGLAYPDFNASEITRADELVKKLLKRCAVPAACEGHERHNAFAFYCRERIDETSVRLWGKFEAGQCPPEELKANLAKEFNALVAGPCLYDAELRADVPSFAGAKFAALPGEHPGRKRLKPVRLPLHGLYGRASLKKFFDAETSPGVKRLGRETERLLLTARAAQPGSYELARLNRLLVEDAFPDEISSGYFPDAEGIEPERTEKYLRETRGTARDGAGDDEAYLLDERKRCEQHAERDRDLMSAGRDPVHHLRLFSNYLTPRKGLLSNDTWRAVAVITRDLVMTWLILLPVILAAVLLGQLYFILCPSAESSIRRIAPRHDFVTSYESEIALAKGRLESIRTRRALMMQALSGEGPDAATLDEARRADLVKTVEMYNVTEQGEATRLAALRSAAGSWIAHRLKLMVVPLVAIFGLIVLMVSAWNVLNNTGTNSQSIFAGVAVWLIIGFSLFVCVPNLWVWPLYDRWGTWRGLSATPYFPAKLALLALYAVVGFLFWKHARRRPKAYAGVSDGLDPETRTQRIRDVQRNQMVRMQTSLLVYFVVTALVLLVAGFGHEFVGRMINLDSETRSAIIARWGGIAATVLGLAGAIFTAVKATPAGGGDQKETEVPSLPSRIIFACTPPLIIVLLFMGAAWLAHGMIQAVTAGEEFRVRIPPLTWAMSVSIIVGLGFAVLEMGWRRRRPTEWLVGLAIGSCVLAVGYDFKQEIISPFQRVFPLALLAFSTVCVVLRLCVKEATSADDGRRVRAFRFVVAGSLLGRFRPTARQLIAAALVSTAALLVCFFAVLWLWEPAWVGVMDRSVGAHRLQLASFALAGLLFCAGLLVTEILRGAGDHRRALGLLAAGNVALGALLVMSLYANYRQFPRLLLFHAAFGLLTSALGWVVALGWLADPNALSLHDFYKARLVRAYLGASNPVRKLAPTEVTESAEGDDLPLSQLKNCQRGGPYHLVNATLNLAAARDLTTAQRSSAAFVLSKLNCGSSRTGFRRTDRYMSGRLSLGTAVATSGAAASPNMGSRTPSASLAMLMTLLNVRLGYWAPTPNKEHWQLTQAQLWPFYVLREFLSQTNDLSSYSYLTDGGHFDNTGLYSLVERGCRFIVVADSGADPAPCFSDLGDAIRRCRIDFGAEITLRVETFFSDEKTRLAPGHFVVGKITYCGEHLRRLRWTDEEIERGREGVIVLFKPSLTSEVSADVRQYGIENKNFPQQGTADQWFDESQFESYRRLGEHCARQLFRDFVTEGKPEGSKEAEAARARRGRAALSLEEIRYYFEGLYERYNDTGAEARRRRVREELWRVVAAESAGRGVELTPGCRHYLEDLVAEGASKLGAAESDSPELGAAKENLRRIVREAARRAWCAGTRRLHESVLIEAADARTAYPFFEKDANGHGNGRS